MYIYIVILICKTHFLHALLTIQVSFQTLLTEQYLR